MAKHYGEILDHLRSSGNFRQIPHEPANADGFIDLSGNDYLGLPARKDLQTDFFNDPEKRLIPMTSSASRLLSARQREYDRLESLLESLYSRPCLIFNSGYHANTGIIQSLASAGTLIVADKLVHASIIDGITLSKAPFTRFRHNDFEHLERIIKKEASSYERIIVITESIYSMDGDRNDIDSLLRIKRLYPHCILYIDEAHAFGAEGAKGLGLCRENPHYEDIDIIVGTFGKACASAGAFCAVSSELRDYLVNRARSLIFSTALPPISAAWTCFMIETMLDMDHERQHLRKLGKRLQLHLQPLSPHFDITASHIQPLVLGSSARAIQTSEKLMKEGFKVLPIRTPTVPPGTERLRISLNATLKTEDIDRLGDALKKTCGQ